MSTKETPAHRKWRQDNRHKTRVYGLRWYYANRDRVVEYRSSNPGVARNAHRKHRSIRKGIIIDAKNKPCNDCGKRYPSFCMDFDHVRGIKRFNIGGAGARGFSLDELRKEISKCDVVCAMCHRFRTHAFGRGLEH